MLKRKREKKLKLPNWSVYVIGGIFVLLVAILIYFVFFRNTGSDNKPGVNMGNFELLKEGMSKEKVFQILGEDSCIIAGFTTKDGIDYANYSCANSDGSNIQLMFKDNKLLEKENFGF